MEFQHKQTYLAPREAEFTAQCPFRGAHVTSHAYDAGFYSMISPADASTDVHCPRSPDDAHRQYDF
ncbi:hypothetical protein SXCC_03212 [Gluconacetobacter sp. SXCC-1]|nr:hypothetical protein SXCC_03212 [Gluconacetobacter sp. SXCC-1]